MNKPTCSFDGCKNPSRARGWCPGHYGQWRRGAKLAPLKPSTPDAGTIEEQFARKVIKRDGCWGWNGGLMHGYGRVRVDGKNIVAHRVSYEMAYGPIGEGMMIDHICHTRECTRPDHLREVTPQQNSQHRIGKNPNNTSGRHGVHWRKDVQKWQVVVRCMDVTHHVGYFDDLDEAAEAARLKRNELFTHNDRDRNAA